MSAKSAPARPMPRLYLATPVVDDATALAAKLPDILAGADVAAVLLRLADSDPRTLLGRIKTLADVAAALKDGYAAAGHSLTGRN